MRLEGALVYEEPGIQLYCGDCREILPQLQKVVLVQEVVVDHSPLVVEATPHHLDQ